MKVAFFALLLILLSSPGITSAQVGSQSGDRPVVAATVDGDPIYLSTCRFQVNQVLRDRNVDAATMDLMYAQSLHQLVSRRLIVEYLESTGIAATSDEINFEIDKVTQHFESREKSLASYLKETKQTAEGFRRSLKWQLSWQRYLNKYVTDSSTAAYFEKHRRDFDGTELKVAHILINPDNESQTRTWEEARRYAASIRKQIADGSMTFAEAAKTDSHSVSGEKGGEIGWIRRGEPMSESFSRAAFALEKGELSQPVESSFGVHLIQCVEIKPGEKRWQEVKSELNAAMTRFLFDWVANKQRPNAQIQFSGHCPHFKSGSREVIGSLSK